MPVVSFSVSVILLETTLQPFELATSTAYSPAAGTETFMLEPVSFGKTVPFFVQLNLAVLSKLPFAFNVVGVPGASWVAGSATSSSVGFGTTVTFIVLARDEQPFACQTVT